MGSGKYSGQDGRIGKEEGGKEGKMITGENRFHRKGKETMGRVVRPSC